MPSDLQSARRHSMPAALSPLGGRTSAQTLVREGSPFGQAAAIPRASSGNPHPELTHQRGRWGPSEGHGGNHGWRAVESYKEAVIPPTKRHHTASSGEDRRAPQPEHAE